jgi:hypothetical protein
MSTQISTAKDLRAGQTPETRALFIAAEKIAIDIGHDIESLYRFKNEPEPMPQLRHCLSYVLRKDYGWTYTAIGKVFNSDHASPLYGYRCTVTMLQIKDPIARRFINKLSKNHGTNTKDTKAQCISCTCGASQGQKVP